MSFINTIQENMLSTLFIWSIFSISIFLSLIYQKSRLYSAPDGIIRVRSMTKSFQVLWAFLIVIGPSLLFGFRDYSVGADTINIVNKFLGLSYVNSFTETFDNVFSDGFLYAFIRYITYKLSNGNPTFYLTCLSFITLYILFRALDKWIDKISLPLALFIYYSFFAMQLLNQSRQMLALSVLFFALSLLVKKEYIKYYFIILVASMVHFTALIGFLFPLFQFKHTYIYPIKKWFFYFLLLLSPLLFYPIFSLLTYVVPNKYSYYLTNISFDGIGLGLFLNVVPVILPIILFRRYLLQEKYAFLARLGMLSFPLRLSGYYSYFIMRMYYYGAIAIIVIVPYSIKNMKNKTNRRCALITVIFMYLIYYIVNYMYLDIANMFPYKSVFNS